MSNGDCPHGEPYGAGFACPVCVEGEALEDSVSLGPVFAAKYEGSCADPECRTDIEPNDECRYVVSDDGKFVYHRSCAEVLSR